MTSPTSQQHAARDYPSLLVGIGSAHGDDQCGWIVADQLQKRCGHNVRVRRASVPLDLLNWIDDCAKLHIVDACDGDRATGHLFRWEWYDARDAREGEAPAESPGIDEQFVLRGTGTHDFDVLSVLQVARQMRRLPESVTIWGIQGERFAASDSVSTALTGRLPAIVRIIARELLDARTFSGEVAADAG